MFTEEMIRAYLSEYPTLFNIQWEKFVGLGRVDENDTHEKYSMSHLAAHVAQEINGVSDQWSSLSNMDGPSMADVVPGNVCKQYSFPPD